MSNETQWPTVRLGDHTTVKARLGWKGLKAEEYVEDGYIFLATPNLKGHQIDFHNVDYITKWRYDESPEIQLRIGDVLIVKDGSTLGICNYVRRLPRPTTLNGSIAVVRTRDTLDSGFLFHFVKGDDFQKLIALKKSGLGVPHLFQADLREFPISLPTVPEQRKIARILTTLDSLIEKTEELIAKYQAIKQGMIHDLFTRGVDEHGQLRPTQQQAPDLYKQSELGWIPRDWDDQLTLGECIEFITDYRGKTPPTSTGGIPIISAETVGDGFLKPTTKRVSEQTYKAWTTRGFPEPGDVIFTTEAPVGAIAALPADQTYLLTRRVIALRPKQGRLKKRYLYWRMILEGQKSTWLKYQHGSTVPRILKPDLLNHAFPLPLLKEQAEVGKRLDSCQSVIDCEQDALAKFKLQKSGLMQDLLTGKVRVKVDGAEEVAAHA